MMQKIRSFDKPGDENLPHAVKNVFCQFGPMQMGGFAMKEWLGICGTAGFTRNVWRYPFSLEVIAEVPAGMFGKREARAGGGGAGA